MAKRTALSPSSASSSFNHDWRDSRAPSSPSPKSSTGFFSKRLSIFGSSGSSNSKAERRTSLYISSPTSNPDLTDAPESPAISFRSSMASTYSPLPQSTYTPSILSVASSTCPSSPASPAPNMASPTMPSSPSAPKVHRIRRKAVKYYEDESPTEDSSASARTEHRRTLSVGTEGMWQAGAGALCREPESPPLKLETEEDSVDGLWSSTALSPSFIDRDDVRASCWPSSPRPSLPSLRSSSPALSQTSFRRGHSRASSSLSFNSANGVHISPLRSPRPSAHSSFSLPKLEMPLMPTLFPSCTRAEAFDNTAEPTPLARDSRNPFDSHRTYSRSSSSSSDDSSSTAPTEPEDDSSLAVKRRGSVATNRSGHSSTRPSIFRVESGGKSIFIEAPSQTSPRCSIYSVASRESHKNSFAESESDVLEIRLVA